MPTTKSKKEVRDQQASMKRERENKQRKGRLNLNDIEATFRVPRTLNSRVYLSATFMVKQLHVDELT